MNLLARVIVAVGLVFVMGVWALGLTSYVDEPTMLKALGLACCILVVILILLIMDLDDE